MYYKKYYIPCIEVLAGKYVLRGLNFYNTTRIRLSYSTLSTVHTKGILAFPQLNDMFALSSSDQPKTMSK